MQLQGLAEEQRQDKLRRARLRKKARRLAKKGKYQGVRKTAADIYEKPLHEWDLEELAHGRPRNKLGDFRGPPPAFIPREVFDRAQMKFVEEFRGGLTALSVPALEVLNDMLLSKDVDRFGRRLVSANVKAQVAMFLVEHVVGKPTQRVEQDVSVRLQAVLGAAMANPLTADEADEVDDDVLAALPAGVVLGALTQAYDPAQHSGSDGVLDAASQDAGQSARKSWAEQYDEDDEDEEATD